MKVDISIPISKTWLLSKLTEEEIFAKYLDCKPNLHSRFLNVLRGDGYPDCKFYRDTRGVLKFHDFAYGYNWDCFNVVEFYYSTKNFYEVCRYIARDFNLLDIDDDSKSNIFYTQKIKLKEKKRYLRVKRRTLNKSDISFWKSFNILEETLFTFDTSGLMAAWLDEDLFYTWVKGQNSYIYHFPEFGLYEYQLYFPYQKKPYPKFIHVNSNLIQGYKQLPTHGETLIITKSRKDVMAMYEDGITAIGLISESVMLSEEMFIDLYNRFDNIFSLMDNDLAGKRMAIKLKHKYGVPPLLFPANMDKDYSGNIKNYGRETVLPLVEKAKLYYGLS